MKSNQGIRLKIKSIENTKKITAAMQLVAASKMKKAQDLMLKARPYASHLKKVVGHVVLSNHTQHFLFADRPLKRIAYIVISSKRGLCGGLNNNLFRSLLKKIIADKEQGIESSMVLIGQKAIQFFRESPVEILAMLETDQDTPALEELIGVLGLVLRAFEDGYIDRAVLSFNLFVNSMTQEPTFETLLPLYKNDFQEEQMAETEYLYDMNQSVLIDHMLTRYIESRIYQSILENYTSEQAARMLAMRAATDNAKEFIKHLKLAYNKARQAAITQEIIEIISGASAVGH